jgi:hypothetical protein
MFVGDMVIRVLFSFIRIFATGVFVSGQVSMHVSGMSPQSVEARARLLSNCTYRFPVHIGLFQVVHVVLGRERDKRPCLR